ncbi:TetR/AcrR family transcriptional regulator C-terminal domain-containing protein [Cryptosporangium sp. NPDC051539]|uniref:TetR/AcrR family transcriptional regulator C-terminal domain-containing protein n=1 Tax=Cryptosporangium sp. NPDC051539 TaxID=3363962 RepID=UPI0037B8B74E
MALDRAVLVRTAVRLIDEGGLDSLTLRRLAAELGVQAPALYWHFTNKRELLDAVAEHLAQEQRSAFASAPAEGQPWWEWLEQRTLEARAGMLAHRDSALVAAGNRPTPDALPDTEALLRSLTSVGLAPADALMFVLASGYYLIGGVLERQLSAARDSGESDRDTFDLMADADQYPQLAAAMAGFATMLGGSLEDGADVDPGEAQSAIDDEVFRFGLGLMIDGLRARLSRS